MAPPCSTNLSAPGDTSQVTNMQRMFTLAGRVQPRHRFMGYFAGHEHGSHVQVRFARSTKTSDLGLPQQVRNMWEMFYETLHVQPRYRLVEYLAGHGHGPHVPQSHRVQPGYRQLGYLQGHGHGRHVQERACSTKISATGICSEHTPSLMFEKAYAFHQDITGWSNASLTTPPSMFTDATAWLDRLERRRQNLHRRPDLTCGSTSRAW